MWPLLPPQLRDEVVGLGPLGGDVLGAAGLRPSRWANPVNIEKAIENDDFSIENGDFPIRNGDVPIKSCDFPIKNGHRKLVDLPSYKMVIYKRVCRVDVTWWTWKKADDWVIQQIQFSHMLFDVMNIMNQATIATKFPLGLEVIVEA